ncbi:hypothetical protein [Bacillus suaedae]|uniref:ABC transporter permease subunit n=1 Tax=Halalkalibacter suaedae TaxID=2822140 RepID=A0A941AR55_9BACI|nr:hypothetical protein [Bacillus suaedae]MBP3953546.1 hypothetical protein [Bacillus suaedae]
MRSVKYPTLWLGGFGLVLLLFLFLFGPHLPNVDKEVSETSYYFNGKTTDLDIHLPPYPPSDKFILGSDSEGHDMYSAMIMGTRETLLTVFIISIVTFAFAIPFGLGASHIPFLRIILEGWNILFSRVPALFLILIVCTIPVFLLSPHRPIYMIVLIIILEIGKMAELVFQSIKEIQKTAYYEAAKTMGTKVFGMWKWYYWPSCSPLWLSSFITHIGSILFLIGQLGLFNIFLSQQLFQRAGGPGQTVYGIENISNVWPVYLNNIFNNMISAPWVPITAASFIAFSMLTFILLGDGLLKYFRKLE